MEDVFNLLGHLLTAVTKLLRHGGAMHIIGGDLSFPSQRDWQFAMHTFPSERCEGLQRKVGKYAFRL